MTCERVDLVFAPLLNDKANDMNFFIKSAVCASAVMATSAMAEEWESSADLGLSLSKGNTDSSLFRTAVQTKKKDLHQSYFGALRYSYGDEDGEANEDEILAKATYKQALEGRNFFGVRFDARTDAFADIDYRFSLNLTYGYYWIETEVEELTTELGLGLTVEDKGEGRDAYLNGLFDQHYERQLNEHAKVFQNLTFSPRLGDVSDYRIDFDAGIETKVTETVAFKVTLENRYESQPAEDKKSNDLKIIAGLSYTF